MKIFDFIDRFAISTKWILTHLLKKIIVVLFCCILFPLLLISLALELFSDFLLILHKIIDLFFTFVYDANQSFFIALFKAMGFYCGKICIGERYTQKNITIIKKLAKENGVRIYVINELVRERDEFFVKVIVPRETDLNLLKLLIGSYPKDNTVF